MTDLHWAGVSFFMLGRNMRRRNRADNPILNDAVVGAPSVGKILFAMAAPP